ncbi:hypothetical protein [Zunongwangia sp. H14]|uniref:hypothetical protein n=1 Tax=Zunongwangia sp. H14 TaxID=3240792 RepID=UPI0035676CF1
MKKVHLIFALLGVTLFSCEPMDDLQAEANAEIDNTLTEGEANYTLVEEDYDEVGLEITTGFSSYEQAQELIPDVLNNAFPLYQNGTSIITSFNVYDPIVPTEYTVTEEDYAAVDNSSGYFASTSQIQSFLEYKFDGAQKGAVVELTYQGVVANDSIQVNDDDFDAIGEEFAETYPVPASSAARYSNFDAREGNDAYWSESMIVEALEFLLPNKIDGVEGQIYEVYYETYDGSPGMGMMNFVFDGNSFSLVTLGSDYVLSQDNYTLISNELSEDYPDPSENLGEYYSFDIRPTNANYWNSAMILEAVNIALKDEFPSASEGDKFLVEYDIYNGSTSANSIGVVLSDGEYVVDVAVSVVETTNPFYLGNSGWNMPVSLSPEDYTEMGQTPFANFDDESEALYKLGIFLGRLYPYAQEGDYAVVEYAFYDGSTNTRYTSFTFQDGKWVGAPRVVESTLQFARTEGVWVPDNTIKYALTGADYGTIAAALEDEYPDPVSSMENYSNFDRRNGNAAYWSDDMLEEAMIILLNSIAPNAEVGQKYEITYDVYNGSNITETITLIKNDAGNWVRFVEE